MIHEYPLEGKPPMMTHIFENNSGERIIAAKGAPEAILEVAQLSEDEKENAFCHNLPPNTFLGFAQKDNNNNFNGCLTLDNSILKDTSLLKIKSIIETYKLRSDD